MSKFMILVKQLYKQKIRSKPFLLMLGLYIVIISAIVFWSDIKEVFVNSEQTEIALINKTDYDMQSVFVSGDETKWVFLEAADEELDQKLEDGSYLAAITLTEAGPKLAADIQSYDPLQLNDQQMLYQEINNAGQFYAMGKLDLTDEQASTLLDSEPIVTTMTLNTEAKDGKTTDEKQAGILISYGVGFLIYLFINTFLSMITTDVASEKGSRALEMLLVSVKPETHFRSKLVGVLLLAITQFTVLLGFLFVLLRFTKGGEKWEMVSEVFTTISLSYFSYVLAFLFGTLFLFLIIGAFFGSLVSKVEEASQVMMPAILITIVGFYVLVTGMSNPDTMLIKVFSYIPFTSGMVMPLRIGATDISPLEPLVSLAILVATVLILYKLSLSFYKRSVLTYSSGGIISKIKTVFKVTT
ncbi:ABC transporter permease [Solibacillus sp. FSL H8-0538]|uniref:ABC transporter permease n=1 Tax=Solibacillus sp. FSL H8-0538 TaxID=2921400 RepID=UPI0030FA4A79